MIAATTLAVIFLFGVLAAVIALSYFVFAELRRDHTTGEYHFTWGVGIVALFLLGLAPGIVGLGLYLTVERQYPLYWLVLCLFAVVLLLVIVGFGADSTAAVAASGTESIARI